MKRWKRVLAVLAAVAFAAGMAPSAWEAVMGLRSREGDWSFILHPEFDQFAVWTPRGALHVFDYGYWTGACWWYFWSWAFIRGAQGMSAWEVRRKPERARQMARRIRTCEECGYDLRATPLRCPECGTVPKPQFVMSEAEAEAIEQMLGEDLKD